MLAIGGGGQTVAINNGQAQLSGMAFSSSAPIQMPSDLLAAAQDATEGNTFLFFKDSEIFGIEADITIPSAGNQIEVGIYLASLDKSPLDSLGIELVNAANGSFIKLDYLASDGLENEANQSGSLDTFYQLQITKIDGKTSHYLRWESDQTDSIAHHMMKIIGPLGLLMTMVHLTQLLPTMYECSGKNLIHKAGCGQIIIHGPIPMKQGGGYISNWPKTRMVNRL